MPDWAYALSIGAAPFSAITEREIVITVNQSLVYVEIIVYKLPSASLSIWHLWQIVKSCQWTNPHIQANVQQAHWFTTIR
jgi:hypothetical protein